MWAAIPVVYKYIGAGVLLLLTSIAIVTFIHDHFKHEQYIDNEFQNKGAITERAQSQSETINAVQNAQEAVRKPTTDQLNIVCSKYDRNCPHGS